MDATEILKDARIVPVVVVPKASVAVPLAETLLEGGINTIEITLRSDSALAAIESIAKNLPDMTVGAGSIRRAEQFSQIENAGAVFAVSPGSSDVLLAAAEKYALPFVPGAVTASEVIYLHERGYALTKFFPAELAGGISMIKALSAPLPESRFFPTGGITPASATEYLALPNVACVGGSWLTPGKLLEQGDFRAIKKMAIEASNLGG